MTEYVGSFTDPGSRLPGACRSRLSLHGDLQRLGAPPAPRENIRCLLKDLHLRGISVRNGRGTASGYIDTYLPSVDHEHPYHVLAKDCALCAHKSKARERLNQLILAGFPDLDDRSEPMNLKRG